MVFLWYLIFWVVVVGFGSGAAICLVVGFAETDFGWRTRLTLAFCGLAIAVLLLVGLTMVPGSLPSDLYVEIGKTEDDSKPVIVVDRIRIKDGKVVGDRIFRVDQDHKIIFTQDENKIGKFRWAFGWREYRNIKEDVEAVVGEKDGIVYFISKSTGEVKTMKKE